MYGIYYTLVYVWCSKYYPFNDIAIEWYIAVSFKLYIEQEHERWAYMKCTQRVLFTRNQMCAMEWDEINWTELVRGIHSYVSVCACMCVDCTDFQNIPIVACIRHIRSIYFVIVLVLLYSVCYTVSSLKECNGSTTKLFPLCTHKHMHAMNSTPQQPIHSFHMCERWECFTHTYTLNTFTFYQTYSLLTHARTHTTVQWSVRCRISEMFLRSVCP